MMGKVMEIINLLILITITAAFISEKEKYPLGHLSSATIHLGFPECSEIYLGGKQ